MSATKLIHGIYRDEEQLKVGALKLRAARVRVKEVFSPFPIHGLDPIIGIDRTWISICAFIYGLTGMSLALLMTYYMMIKDWPTDIGGKPSFFFYMNIPAFIPVTFESTVFCAGHGMALTFFLRSWILPGVSPKNPDPRTTDDMFLMEIEAKPEDEQRIVAMLKDSGAAEVNVK
jgi:hypothetical protein